MSRLSATTPPNVPTCPETSAPKRKSATSGPQTATSSKTTLVVKKLRSAKGVTLGQLTDLTGWQQHSVCGFLSGTVRKKLELTLVSELGKDNVRRYRILDERCSGKAPNCDAAVKAEA